MENENDSLARTAHVFGMTDLEFEARSQFESELAAQQIIRRRMEEEQELPSVEDYGEDWEEYMLHGDPNWDWPKSLIIKRLRRGGVVSRWPATTYELCLLNYKVLA